MAFRREVLRVVRLTSKALQDRGQGPHPTWRDLVERHKAAALTMLKNGLVEQQIVADRCQDDWCLEGYLRVT